MRAFMFVLAVGAIAGCSNNTPAPTTVSKPEPQPIKTQEAEPIPAPAPTVAKAPEQVAEPAKGSSKEGQVERTGLLLPDVNPEPEPPQITLKKPAKKSE